MAMKAMEPAKTATTMKRMKAAKTATTMKPMKAAKTAASRSEPSPSERWLDQLPASSLGRVSANLPEDLSGRQSAEAEALERHTVFSPRACYNCLCTARRQREDDRRQRDVFSNVLAMHRQSGR